MSPQFGWNYKLEAINSLWPIITIWWYRSGSTLDQVMACCLTAPSHYLNQCWPVSSSDVHPRAISEKITESSITKPSLKITYLKFHSNFVGFNGLSWEIRMKCVAECSSCSRSCWWRRALVYLWRMRRATLHYMSNVTGSPASHPRWRPFTYCWSRELAWMSATTGWGHLDASFLFLSSEKTTSHSGF